MVFGVIFFSFFKVFGQLGDFCFCNVLFFGLGLIIGLLIVVYFGFLVVLNMFGFYDLVVV